MSDNLVGPLFIRAAMDGVKELLVAYTPELLAEMGRAEFNRFGTAFRGQLMAAPEIWVAPATSVFDDEGQSVHGIYQVVVTLGLVAGDPEQLTDLAIDYVRAAHLAISRNETTLGEPIKRVFVREQNYGGLRAMNKGFAAFPELYVLVESEEDQ